MFSIIVSVLATQPALAWWALIMLVFGISSYTLGTREKGGLTALMGRVLLFFFLALAIIFALIGIDAERPVIH